jgi:hypothetical protein
MENYGFVLPSSDEVATLHLPKASGSFSELYNKMETTAKTTKLRLEVGQALDMTPEEKQISFYNRYFVFKKVRNVDAEQLSLAALDETPMEEAKMQVQTDIANQAIAEATASMSLKPKRRKAPKLNVKSEAVAELAPVPSSAVQSAALEPTAAEPVVESGLDLVPAPDTVVGAPPITENLQEGQTKLKRKKTKLRLP